MSEIILTPKKAQIHVPGVGVVQKADFTQDHAKALLKRAEKAGVNQKAFIKQHFEIGVSDLPLFDENEEKSKGKKGKAPKPPEEAEEEKKAREDKELLAQLEAEEEEKKKAEGITE